MAIPIIGDIIGAIIGPVKDIISEVVVDKDKRDQINLELDKLEAEGEVRIHDEIMAQIDVNKTEAASGSLFVAGWRPFVGWVGGAGLAYAAILQPLMTWIAMVEGYKGSFPVFDTNLLMTVLGGLLGLGSLRTYEKVKGVGSNDLSGVTPDKVVAAKTGEPIPQSQVEAPVQTRDSAGSPTKQHKHFHLF